LALSWTVQGQTGNNNTVTPSSTAQPGNVATPGANATNATTTAPTTAPPTRPPWPKPNCGNPALNNGLRNVFLDMHNDFRGRVARGQTEVSAGWGIAPPAALMYRMKYDCNAESYAQQSVANCRRTELPAYARGGHKQNLFVLNHVQANPKAVIHYALSQWWSQLARFGMRSNMMFYQSEYNRGARNVLSWAKMAWWNNRRVGCSVKHCGSFYVVSCMYSPGGLNVNQHVYRVGAVCSGCPHGQCDGQALCRW
ncbi:SCP-like protein, partial [Ancylostoma caninum]